jgi:hypothetical protein
VSFHFVPITAIGHDAPNAAGVRWIDPEKAIRMLHHSNAEEFRRLLV